MSILTKTNGSGLAMAWSPALPRPPWWAGYALSLFLPLSIFGYLVTGPHHPWATLAWTIPMWLLVAGDFYGPAEVREVPPDAPRGFFNGLLYLLALLQWLNVLALGLMVSRLGFETPQEAFDSLVDLLAIRLMVGANFTCAGLCPAHELIHRRNRWQRWLGRAMLISLCYDHFAVAHRRIHHARLGSALDPSTARAGECFEDFFLRTIREQWRLAWQTSRSAVLAGLAVEAVWVIAYAWSFGLLATLMYAFMVFSAIRTLESVNYFQHYGLTEDTGRVSYTAWRCDSAVSLFLFVGLTRHADHHRHPRLRYEQLRALSGGPSLPFGYLGMAVWTQRQNDGYRAWEATSRQAAPESA